MFHKFEGKYDKIILEPLKKEDIEDLRLLRNKKENRECFIYQKEISKEELQKNTQWNLKYYTIEFIYKTETNSQT